MLFALVLAIFAYAWLARTSLSRSLDMVAAKSCYRQADQALQAGHNRQAWRFYARGAELFDRFGEKMAFAVERGSEYLIAGNCYRRLGNFRSALQYYRKGLAFEPHSINLLTSAGFCAAKLGEKDLAIEMLQRSQSIHTLNREARQLLQALRSGS